MSFANIYWGILILLLPKLYQWREAKLPATLPHPDAVSRIMPSSQVLRRKLLIPKILRLTAIVLLILALMRPQHSLVADTTNRFGTDIMVVLDVSSSMTAEDFTPNRITVAKGVLADFIRGRPSDRLGLVVFGSQSYLQSPLTTDHKTLLSLLEDVKIGLAEDGTAIGMALANAVKRLKDSPAKSKSIFLLTDGDNNAGAIDPETAARLAATYNIKIYAIGIGNPEGAPIAIIDPFGNKVYARNLDGSIFLTKMNAAGLKKIADVTGGNYYLASDNDKLGKTFQEIDRLEKTKMTGKTPYVYDEQYAGFAWLALFLILLEYGIRRFWLRLVL